MMVTEEKTENGYFIRKGIRTNTASDDKTITFQTPQIEVQAENVEQTEKKKWWQFWKRGK